MSRLPSLEAHQVKEIALRYIHPTDQIRKTFNEQSLKELADDILLRGIEQPLIVTPNGGDGWNIKHGERRYRAAELAGLEKVPVILVKKETGEGADLNRLFDQYAENMQRDDLNFIDLAHFFKLLRDDHKIRVSDIPDLLTENGFKEMSRSYISNIIRLLDLPEWVTDRIIDGSITPGHAKYMMPMLDCEKVTATVKEEIESYFKDESPYMAFSHDFIKEMVNDAYAGHHPSVERVRDWGPEENQTLFELDALSDEEKTELKIRKIVDESGNTYIYALNHEAHQKFNTGKPKGKSKRVASSSSSGTNKSTVKAPGPKTQANRERLQDHLHEWLRVWLHRKLALLETAPSDFAQDIRARLLLWAAYYCPDTLNNGYSHEWQSYDGIDPKERDKGLTVLNLHSLDDFLTTELPADSIINEMITALINSIDFYNSKRLATFLEINIAEEFKIDEAFVKMYTRAGLLKLMRYKKASADFIDNFGKPVKELKKHVLENFKGLPEDIQALWNETNDE